MKALRSDNGGEFVSEEFESFLRGQGVTHQKSAPHTPQQNGVAERGHRSIMEAARAMLFQANLSVEFWPDVRGGGDRRVRQE